MLQEYLAEGWRGIHTEGSFWSNLTMLLFLDILFSYKIDAFHVAYQGILKRGYGTLKRVVWYFEEGDVVLRRGDMVL